MTDENEIRKTRLTLDWMTETERDIFGVPYMGHEKETHARLNVGLGTLDNRHIAPFLRIIDVAPIIEMAITRLWELSITSDPAAKAQTKAILETATKIPIKAALKHLPQELRLEILEELREEGGEYHG